MSPTRIFFLFLLLVSIYGYPLLGVTNSYFSNTELVVDSEKQGIYYLKSNRSVGIGTANPAATLNVRGKTIFRRPVISEEVKVSTGTGGGLISVPVTIDWNRGNIQRLIVETKKPILITMVNPAGSGILANLSLLVEYVVAPPDSAPISFTNDTYTIRWAGNVSPAFSLDTAQVDLLRFIYLNSESNSLVRFYGIWSAGFPK